MKKLFLTTLILFATISLFGQGKNGLSKVKIFNINCKVNYSKITPEDKSININIVLYEIL